MTTKNNADLRKEIKKMLIDAGLDGRGQRKKLASMLHHHLGQAISTNTLCMAMTGHRTGPAYHTLLESIRELLLNREHIHNPSQNATENSPEESSCR